MDDGCVPRYLSNGSYEDVLTLNLFDKHLSYVSNRDAYLVKWKCGACSRHFDHKATWKRHQGTCGEATKHVFPGGYLQPPVTIHERLHEAGIITTDKVFPWYAVWDCEAVLLKSEEKTEKCNWTHRHEVSDTHHTFAYISLFFT